MQVFKSRGNNNQIYNNLIYTSGVGDYGDGILVYYGYGNRIYNNTIYNNTQSGINLSGNASGTEVRNNIVYAAGNVFRQWGFWYGAIEQSNWHESPLC